LPLRRVGCDFDEDFDTDFWGRGDPSLRLFESIWPLLRFEHIGTCDDLGFIFDVDVDNNFFGRMIIRPYGDLMVSGLLSGFRGCLNEKTGREKRKTAVSRR